MKVRRLRLRANWHRDRWANIFMRRFMKDLAEAKIKMLKTLENDFEEIVRAFSVEELDYSELENLYEHLRET